MGTWRPAYREGYGRRMALAVALSCVALGAAPFLRLSAGCSGRGTARSVAGHTGAQGELRLLPEINLAHADDAVTRWRQQSMARASRGVDVQVATKPVSTAATPPATAPDATTPDAAAPPPRGLPRADVTWQQLIAPTEPTGREARTQVELNRPSQQSLEFVLVKFVRPRYPQGVPAALLMRRIVVHAAMYVGTDGRVSDAYVIRSEGGPPFDREVLSAIRQWEYRPLVVDRAPQPFWDQIKVTFVGVPSGKGSSEPSPGG